MPNASERALDVCCDGVRLRKREAAIMLLPESMIRAHGRG